MKWFKRAARPETVDTPDAVSPEMLELRGVVDMIDRTQARIMFTPDGTILWANDNFLEVMKYDLPEIVGKHHSLFLSEAERSMPGYREFWAQLAGGAFFQDQFARIAKDGSTVWIRATYAPVFDAQGKVVRVMKIANDITGRQSEIETLAACLARMEDGILAQQVPVAVSDDLARLGTALGSALARLTGAINAVKTVVEQVTTTAGQIRVSSSDLAQRTEYQAATLEAAAGAVQEITSTLTATAGQARDVRQVAAEAQTTAEESGKVVRDAVEAMQRIETSSNRISQIISVIDEIAFQTNLLALNAGVEAARAGEAGRGFTLVASEVRALARRSSDAAVEIKTLIEESAGDVKHGVDLVAAAGSELDRIVGNIGSVAGLIGEIARGTQEQSQKIAAINTSLGELDQVTQTNTAMVQESNAATVSLADSAQTLAQEMAQFETDPARSAPPLAGAGAGRAMRRIA